MVAGVATPVDFHGYALFVSLRPYGQFCGAGQNGRGQDLVKWLFVDCRLARIIGNQSFDPIVAFIVASYFGTLDIWGSDWDSIKAHKQEHIWIYCTVLFAGTFVLFMRGVKTWIPMPPDPRVAYIASLEELLEGVSRIITEKTERFRQKCVDVTATGDAFEIITQPKAQVDVIIREAHRYFPSRIGTTGDQLDITVLAEVSAGVWDFFATSNDNWTRALPMAIMEGKSLANWCLRTGQCYFIADKKVANQEERYVYSDRDRANGIVGSAFCSPISFKIGQKNYRYLVTFSTYGAKICEPNDLETANNARQLFLQFVKRIELELLLHSIKTHRHFLKRQPNERLEEPRTKSKSAGAKSTPNKS